MCHPLPLSQQEGVCTSVVLLTNIGLFYKGSLPKNSKNKAKFVN